MIPSSMAAVSITTTVVAVALARMDSMTKGYGQSEDTSTGSAIKEARLGADLMGVALKSLCYERSLFPSVFGYAHSETQGIGRDFWTSRSGLVG